MVKCQTVSNFFVCMLSKVLLQKGHCPCCFRNGRNFDLVQRGDSKIDKLQAACCLKNHLRIFNLGEPGRACNNFDPTCCIRCLVCGKSVIDQDEYNFLKVKRYIMKDTKRPVSIRDISEDVLCMNVAVFVREWRTPVHFQCTYLAPCRCRLVRGQTTCPKHVIKVSKSIQKVMRPVKVGARYVNSSFAGCPLCKF